MKQINKCSSDIQKKNLRFRYDLKLSEATCHYLEVQYIFTIDDYCKQVYDPVCGGMMDSFNNHWQENREIMDSFEKYGLSDFVADLKRHYSEDKLSFEEILQMPVGYLELGCNSQFSLLLHHIRTVGDCYYLSDEEWSYISISRKGIEDI